MFSVGNTYVESSHFEDKKNKHIWLNSAIDPRRPIVTVHLEWWQRDKGEWNLRFLFVVSVKLGWCPLHWSAGSRQWTECRQDYRNRRVCSSLLCWLWLTDSMQFAFHSSGPREERISQSLDQGSFRLRHCSRVLSTICWTMIWPRVPGEDDLVSLCVSISVVWKEAARISC